MRNFLAAIALMVCAAVTAHAQNGPFAPYVFGSASTSSNLGYKNPDFSFGAGVESSTRYLLVDVHGAFDSANLQKTDNGYAGSLQGSAHYKFFGHFLAGGGANWSIQTSTLKKQFGSVDSARQSAHPFVGGGFQFGKVRVLGSYDLPGNEALPDEKIVNLVGEIFVSKHFRVTPSAVLESYSGAGKRSVSASKLGLGLKLVL